MNFLKRKTSWVTAELWIFKWGVFTSGILAGGYFWTYLQQYRSLIWFVAVSCCLLAAYFWFAKNKHR